MFLLRNLGAILRNLGAILRNLGAIRLTNPLKNKAKMMPVVT